MPGARQQLIGGWKRADQGRRVHGQERCELVAAHELFEGFHRAGVGRADEDRAFHEARPLPGELGRLSVRAEPLRAVAKEPARYEAAHRVRGDVELHVRLLDAVELPVLLLDVGALLLNEGREALGIGDVVTAPVVVELETGEVARAIVDLAAEPERLVAIAAGSQRREDARVRLDLDRDSGQPDADLLQYPVGLETVPELLDRNVVAQGKREEAHSFGIDAHRARLEDAPGEYARGLVDQTRSEQPRDHDDRVAIGSVIVRGRVVDQGQLGFGIAGGEERQGGTAPECQECRSERDKAPPDRTVSRHGDLRGRARPACP